MIRQLLLATALLTPLAVAAQQLPTAPYLPLDLAVKAAQTAVNACNEQGYNVSVAVVGRDTAGLADFISKNQANDGLRDMDSRMVIQGGGLAIKIGDALVGGDRKSTRLHSR